MSDKLVRSVDASISLASDVVRLEADLAAARRENATLREDGAMALAGVRATRRGAGLRPDEVEVTFTDEGWEAAKRVLSALAASRAKGTA